MKETVHGGNRGEEVQMSLLLDHQGHTVWLENLGVQQTTTKKGHYCCHVAFKISVNALSIFIYLNGFCSGPLVWLSVNLVLCSDFHVTLETHKEAIKTEGDFGGCHNTPFLSCFPFFPPFLFQCWHRATLLF